MGATEKIRGKSDKVGLRKVTEIGILLYPGEQASAVAGLTDLFVVANRLSAGACSPSSRCTSIFRPFRGIAGLRAL
jgi:transcriptional regulator GlxA family with amidase domain